MEPVFTLQWPEFVIAQRLQSLLPRKDGYSVLVPLSRQEKGIDLAMLHRTGTGTSVTTTIQVKAPRTYLHAPPKRTVSGEPDRMFGFGFNDLSQIVLNRGDKDRSGKDYADYLLEHRYKDLMKK